MSRRSSRPEILKTARRLIEERDGSPVTISEIARQAGLSRQGVYLHFAALTDLLLELTREADTTARTPELQAGIDNAPSGRAALQEAVAVQARIKPKIHGLVTAIDVLRRSDDAARAAFEERENARYQRVVDVVKRLESEGQLASAWDVETAARLTWAMMSQRVWEDLGCPDEETYTSEVGTFLEKALCCPDNDR